jgi:hypothetical protein
MDIRSQFTLAIGQRYDVVIEANQTVGNYWFRVQPGTDCGANSILTKGVQVGAVLHYDGADDKDPNSTTTVTMSTACQDEATSSLVPFVPNQVPTDIVSSAGKIDLKSSQNSTTKLFRWLIDGNPHIVDWNNPT